MGNNWIRYTIMLKNKRVASIREDGTCTIYSPKKLPYKLYLEKINGIEYDKSINNLNNFYYWCSNRMLTLDRKYAKEILNSIGGHQSTSDRDRAEIAIAYHAVSFMNLYWIKRNREQIKFEDINLFKNHLSDAFVDVSLKGKMLTAQNSRLILKAEIAGDLDTPGVAPKAWIRQKGLFYLLKGGSKEEVEAELLASKIVQCFNVEQVIYERDSYKGEDVSKCKIVTSLNRSIVSAESVQIYCMNHNKDFFNFVIKKDAYNYYMMNIIDYLIGNNDRHWGNWGFLVDADTNKMLKIHPLMDFNRAFKSYNDLEGETCLTTREKITQQKAAIEAVKAIGLNQIKEIKKEWFNDIEKWTMFSKRLEILKTYSNGKLK